MYIKGRFISYGESLDEVYAIHMAVGASYPDTGGKNVSGLHWDLIKNMKNGGQIYADDELIYENGKFLI